MKSLMPWLRVDLHDVPQDRLAADLDHRLGTHIGFFGKTGSQTTSQQNRLHETLPSLISPRRFGPGLSKKSVSPCPYNNIDGEASQANACLINWFISAQFHCRNLRFAEHDEADDYFGAKIYRSFSPMRAMRDLGDSYTSLPRHGALNCRAGVSLPGHDAGSTASLPVPERCPWLLGGR